MRTPGPLSLPPAAGILAALFPSRGRGSLVVVEGSQDPPPGLFMLLGRGLLEGSRILYLDGANAFDLSQMAALALAHRVEPRRLFRRVLLARAFTSPQLEALVTRLARE